MRASRVFSFVPRVTLFMGLLSIWASCPARGADDPYEDNNSRASAYSLSRNTWLSDIAGDSYQCGTGDEDWYKIVIGSDTPLLRVKAYCYDDLDCVSLHDSSGNQLAVDCWSQQIGITDARQGTYYICVRDGFIADEDCDRYDLIWNAVARDDPYEAQADGYDLTAYEGVWLSHIAGPGVDAGPYYSSSDDYFIIAPQSGTIKVECTFSGPDKWLYLRIGEPGELGRYKTFTAQSSTISGEFQVDAGMWCGIWAHGDWIGSTYDLRWTYTSETSPTAKLVTFDTVTTAETEWIPDKYGGLNWDNFIVSKASSHGASGYRNGLISGDYVAFNGTGNPAEISGDPFNFLGAHFTAAWRNGLTIDIEGFRGTTVVHTESVVANASAPMYVGLNFTNVTRVRFTSHGGTHDPVFSTDGTQFVMDDMEYSMYGSSNWSPDSVEIMPPNPTSCDELTITVSGTSGSLPVPYALTVTVAGNDILVDVLKIHSDVGLPVVTPWQVTSTTGPLSPGEYSVYTRLCETGTASSCTGYELQATLTVAPCDGSEGTYNSDIEPGDRVVLLEQSGDLLPGHAGTVMCKGQQGILVSWDLWRRGSTGLDYCSCGPIADFPTGSASWVDGTVPQEKLGRYFDTTGVLVQGVECVLFQTDGGQLFVLSDTHGHAVGDRIRVQGLLRSPCITICMQGNGCISHTITSSASAGAYPCCDSSCTLRPGDRVVSLYDRAADSSCPELKAGASGTVLVCDADNALVSWDLVTDSRLVLLDEGATWRQFQYPRGSLGQVRLAALGRYVDLGCVTLQGIDTGMVGAAKYGVLAGGRTYTFYVPVVVPPDITQCLADYYTDGANVHLRGIATGEMRIEHRLISPCDTCRVDFCQYAPSGEALSPSTIQAGQTLSLTFGGANCGTADIAAGWKIRYYASLDTTITPGDYLLYECEADFGIASGQQLTLSEAFTFPSNVPAGQYYIGWIFDPDDQICESNENNNAGYVKNSRLRVIANNFEGCGVLVAFGGVTPMGEVATAASCLLFKADDTGDYYYVDNTGGFQAGDHVYIEGSLNLSCQSSYCGQPVRGCIIVTIIIVCPGEPGGSFAGCGVLVDTGYCLLFKADDTGDYYFLDNLGGFGAGDRVYVEGDLDQYCHFTYCGPAVVVRGCIIVTIIIVCPGESMCCDFNPGDRVVLLVRPLNNDGTLAVGLYPGAMGTVVCCDHGDPGLPLFVSWDNWTNGKSNSSFCDPPVISYVPNSGWWMACTQIGRPGQPVDPCPRALMAKCSGKVVSLEPYPMTPTTYVGKTILTLELNFRATVSATVTTTSAAGGIWTASLTPSTVGPGEVPVELYVRGTSVDASALPCAQTANVATVNLSFVPAQ
ncbi:MAG: hypothetical protein JW955_03385 [Sedimentisphaerales bacterium]|nr:hypothetical protein [Sedimentisphaerales bacterium]